MMKKQLQRGFTLVEIAIVLVIIGLLLGGALKGQEMIENAKIKRIKADFDQYVAAFYSYQDRYRSLAGDDGDAQAHLGYADATDDGDGDGLIESEWDSTTANQESRLFWQHLRDAGLISGAGENQPQNSLGGIVGIEEGAAGFNGPALCFSAIPQDTAEILDTSYDDGAGNTGSIRGVTDAEAATAYTNANYGRIICIEI